MPVNRYRQTRYSEYISQIFPELFVAGENEDGTDKKAVRQVTFKVTDDCNLACTYCYQTNKCSKLMSFETAKKLIDALITDSDLVNSYINRDNSPGIIIEFIGGEPLLEAELIGQICEYFEQQLILHKHPWLERYKFSICTNGVNYFDPKVQTLLQKLDRKLSLNITLDGTKEMHDACRVFKNGAPSYDIVIKAVKHNIKYYGHAGTKVTISPQNVGYLYEAIVHMVELGMKDIHANPVFEDVWDNDVHPRMYYEQLKMIADYWMEHDIVESVYNSLFVENLFEPMEESDDKNWCGGNGAMLAMDTKGDLYPCIRYMDTSLDGAQKPMIIGNIEQGIGCNHDCRSCMECLRNITRRSQSTDECWNCPVAKGCAWCTAYNYQVFGTPDKRATFICHMHKARALANIYFWNTYYRLKGMEDRKECFLDYDMVSHIVSREEYDMLINLTK